MIYSRLGENCFAFLKPSSMLAEPHLPSRVRLTAFDRRTCDFSANIILAGKIVSRKNYRTGQWSPAIADTGHERRIAIIMQDRIDSVGKTTSSTGFET
jgi:hypothetical protein